jgi:omega-hydroxy-beta-dihydromenaquinone-9 sulfotransferase
MTNVFAGGPGALLRHARESGGVPAARLPRLLLLLGRMTAATLGLRLERWVTGVGRFRAAPAALPGLSDPPLFILGHYRSGTTLVHKLLAADARFGSVRTFDLFLPTCPLALREPVRVFLQGLVGLLRVRHPFFHDAGVRLDDPNETEPLMLALASVWSSYWGYLFPRGAGVLLNRYVEWPSEEIRRGWMSAYCGTLERISGRCGGRRLVVKDPPNTGRVATLLELFPDAQFIHVVRDPAEVFRSMRGLWDEVILPRYSLQPLGPGERDGILLRHYQTVMSLWQAQKRLIASGNLVDLRYEDLLRDPVVRIREMYEVLRLPPFQAAEQAISARWEEERGYRPRGREGAPALPEEVDTALADWRRRLGYPG